MPSKLEVALTKVQSMTDEQLQDMLRIAKQIARGPDPSSVGVMKVIDGEMVECDEDEVEEQLGHFIMSAKMVGVMAVAVARDEIQRRKDMPQGMLSKLLSSLKPAPKKTKLELDLDRLTNLFKNN